MFKTESYAQEIFETVMKGLYLVSLISIVGSIVLVILKLLGVVSLDWNIVAAIGIFSLFSRIILGLFFAGLCFFFAGVIFIIDMIVEIIKGFSFRKD